MGSEEDNRPRDLNAEEQAKGQSSAPMSSLAFFPNGEDSSKQFGAHAFARKMRCEQMMPQREALGATGCGGSNQWVTNPMERNGREAMAG